MSNDYEVLIQKFNNFQKFVAEIGDEDKVAKFNKLTPDQWICLASANITPYFQNNTMDQAVDEMCLHLNIDKTNEQNMSKLRRYLDCFSEYLLQDDMKEVVKQKTKEIEPIDGEEDDEYLRALANVKL